MVNQRPLSYTRNMLIGMIFMLAISYVILDYGIKEYTANMPTTSRNLESNYQNFSEAFEAATRELEKKKSNVSRVVMWLLFGVFIQLSIIVFSSEQEEYVKALQVVLFVLALMPIYLHLTNYTANALMLDSTLKMFWSGITTIISVLMYGS